MVMENLEKVMEKYFVQSVGTLVHNTGRFKVHKHRLYPMCSTLWGSWGGASVP